jgi:hypothetical protein
MKPSICVSKPQIDHRRFEVLKHKIEGSEKKKLKPAMPGHRKVAFSEVFVFFWGDRLISFQSQK